MSDLCKWLHEQLEPLPAISFPFDAEQLPHNGIYFYEEGEAWGHRGEKPRIVRIRTHKNGNFRSRIAEHYLLDERKMNFDASRPAPRERSILRKPLGRALLNRNRDSYLAVWEIDFTSRLAREKWAHRRDIGTEKQIESRITRRLRENFSFRFIAIDKQVQRMGRRGLESRLIGTVAQCEECRPSRLWLGRHSPRPQISTGRLWLVQHPNAPPLGENDRRLFAEAIERTAQWLARQS